MVQYIQSYKHIIMYMDIYMYHIIKHNIIHLIRYNILLYIHLNNNIYLNIILHNYT